MHTCCKNCDAIMQGDYCHVCGQKNILDEDRRFRHLVELFLAELFSLDGKFWRTAKGIFKPGFLASEYLAGRRSPYLSPVSIFLLVNVLYFVFPVLSDFDLPFNDQIPGSIAAQQQRFENASPEQLARLKRSDGQMHSRWTVPWIEKRLEERQQKNPGYRLDDMATAFDSKSAEVSKLLIIIHVPFLAFALMLMFWRTRKYYAEHFVVALIVFATVLLAIQIVFPVVNMLPVSEQLSGVMTKVMPWVVIAMFMGLIAASFYRVYQ